MNNRLFVGNLPYDATEKQVRELVAGSSRQVTAVKIVTDKETGRSRGFAFVDLDTEEAAKAAIAELNGKDYGGRALVVNEAHDKEQRGSRPDFVDKGGPERFDKRGGGGGGFGPRGFGQSSSRGGQRGGGRGGGRGS